MQFLNWCMIERKGISKNSFMENRIFGFDISRSFSMFYIVGILHLTGYTTLSISQNDSCVSLIWSTLGVFTFLSAYLLGQRYEFSGKKNILKFYKKRIFRFYPLFFISSVLLLLINFNTFDETWKGLLGISPFWIPQQHTLWYIATLIFLYIITPIICYKRFNCMSRIAISILILTIVSIIQLLWHSVDPRFFYYYTVYVLGLFCALYESKTITKILQSKKSLICLVIYIPILTILSYYHNRLLMMIIGYFGAFVILNLSVIIGGYAKKYKQLVRMINFLSFGSMCAYLFHREIYWLFLEIYNPKSDWGIVSYLFIAALPVVFIVSYWIQKLYDQVAQKLAS